MYVCICVCMYYYGISTFCCVPHTPDKLGMDPQALQLLGF